MYIPNFINGQKVNQDDLNNEYDELQKRSSFLNPNVPCIFYGFISNILTPVTTGVTVTISAGAGRGLDVVLPFINNGVPLQNWVQITTDTAVSITAVNGYIVINSNINSTTATDTSFITTDTIQFVTTLTTTFPTGNLIGQIVLYTVAPGIYLSDNDNATRLQFYNPDLLDNPITGEVNIGGNTPGGTVNLKYYSTSGYRNQLISTETIPGGAPQLSFFNTESDGSTINNGFNCFYGSRFGLPTNNIETLATSSTSVMILGDNTINYYVSAGQYSLVVSKTFTGTRDSSNNKIYIVNITGSITYAASGTGGDATINNPDYITFPMIGLIRHQSTNDAYGPAAFSGSNFANGNTFSGQIDIAPNGAFLHMDDGRLHGNITGSGVITVSIYVQLLST